MKSHQLCFSLLFTNAGRDHDHDGDHDGDGDDCAHDVHMMSHHDDNGDDCAHLHMMCT